MPDLEYRVVLSIQQRSAEKCLGWEKSIYETVGTLPANLTDSLNKFVEARTALAQLGILTRE